MPTSSKLHTSSRHRPKCGAPAEASSVLSSACSCGAQAPLALVLRRVPAPQLPPTDTLGRSICLPALLRGKVTAVQLLCAGCSSTCPIQGAVFAAVGQKVRAPDVRLLSLTVDPLGDTRSRCTPGWVALVIPGFGRPACHACRMSMPCRNSCAAFLQRREHIRRRSYSSTDKRSWRSGPLSCPRRNMLPSCWPCLLRPDRWHSANPPPHWAEGRSRRRLVERMPLGSVYGLDRQIADCALVSIGRSGRQQSCPRRSAADGCRRSR